MGINGMMIANGWSYDDIGTFISIWRQENIQEELDGV